MRRKLWEGSHSTANKRRRLAGTSYLTLEKPSESESSGVGSDEEYDAVSVLEDVPLDMNGLAVDGEWQSFVEENRLVAENANEPPCPDMSGNDIVADEYPGAAEIISQGPTLFAQIKETNEYRESVAFFSQQADFAECEFFVNSGLPMRKIDEYRELPSVCPWFFMHNTILITPQVKNRPIPCPSAREMRARMERLPPTVPWEQCEIEVEGAITKEPLTLYYRDGLKCFLRLLAEPALSGHLDLIPRREYTDEGRTERLYNEPMTADLAWNIQVYILLHA